jgi:hypothetical protein
MSKSKKESSKPTSFGGFNILKGNFVPPTDSSPEDNDEVDETEETEEVEEAPKPEDTEETTPPKKKVEDSEEDSTEDKEETTETTSPYKVFAKSLSEKGILDFDDTDEDFEDSDEGLEKLVDKTVKSRIDKWAKSLPDDYVNFLEFVQSGGNPKDFINIYYNNHSWENFELDSEENQKLAVKESLRLAGEADEDINEMVEEWYDNGTLEKRAKSAIAKLKKHEEAEKQNLLEQQKELDTKRKAQEQEYWESFKKDVYSKENINGFKVTDKVKDKLWEFMSIPDKRTGKTAYQKAVETNKDSQLLFAYLAMNNFDVSKLENQVATKVNRQLADTLKNYKDSKDKISKGSTNDNYGDNPFEAFKSAKL